jgi:hypothetical protein
MRCARASTRPGPTTISLPARSFCRIPAALEVRRFQLLLNRDRPLVFFLSTIRVRRAGQGTIGGRGSHRLRHTGRCVLLTASRKQRTARASGFSTGAQTIDPIKCESRRFCTHTRTEKTQLSAPRGSKFWILTPSP